MEAVVVKPAIAYHTSLQGISAQCYSTNYSRIHNHHRNFITLLNSCNEICKSTRGDREREKKGV